MINMLSKFDKEYLNKEIDTGIVNFEEVAIILKRIINGLPEPPESYELEPPESCEGCKWEDNHTNQLTNKYVLCPFCTRYYKDRYQR